jgi:hypothetical protein
VFLARQQTENNMAHAIISVNSVLDMRPVRFSRLAIEIDCEMSEGQMLDALKSFLEQVSGATWASWEREINADSQDMVPCRHEFYQGICQHCALPATEFRVLQARGMK